MPDPQYSRRTLLAAAQVLKVLGHSGFTRLMLELGLPDESVGTGGSLMDRANSLSRYALNDPQQTTASGYNLWDTIVDRSVEEDKCYPPNVDIPNVRVRERRELEAALKEHNQQILDEYAAASPFITEAVERGDSPTAGLANFLDQKRKATVMSENPSKPSKVFIVHGRDDAPKEAVARFVERMGFEAIILHEQVNSGRTVLEKFISHSDVQFAVVLLTPDDVGGLNGESQRPRARQNVILEWGFFIGSLGRENVLALMKAEVEPPSDVAGLVWERLDEGGAWRGKLAKEMETSGFRIDWKKAHS